MPAIRLCQSLDLSCQADHRDGGGGAGRARREAWLFSAPASEISAVLSSRCRLCIAGRQDGLLCHEDDIRKAWPGSLQVTV